MFDMINNKPRVVGNEMLLPGKAFNVRRLTVQLADGVTVQRELISHAPVVVMLVHDVTTDRYLLSREYRPGPNTFTPSIPAGYIDRGETPERAMLREIREETGVAATKYNIHRVGSYYSSEGMSNELATIAVIDLYTYTATHTDFDTGEYISSGWVYFDDIVRAGITASNAVIAIQAEQFRRVTGGWATQI